MKTIYLALLMGACCISCTKNDELPLTANFTDDFETGNNGWTAGFADYSKVMDTTAFNFDTGVSKLPSPVDTTQKGYKIGAKNLSDDLFMFLKKRVTGLAANTAYTVNYQLDIASSAPSNFVGIGGAPGESVHVKIGATTMEPMVSLVNDYYTINIDKGGNSTDGADMKTIGNVANGLDSTTYKIIRREGSVNGTSDSSGNLWLIVGTESGFEGSTVLYYDKIAVDIY